MYTDSTVTAVVSVSCTGNDTTFSECSLETTDIDTDDRCSIESVAEVVCQGMLK